MLILSLMIYFYAVYKIPNKRLLNRLSELLPVPAVESAQSHRDIVQQGLMLLCNKRTHLQPAKWLISKKEYEQKPSFSELLAVLGWPQRVRTTAIGTNLLASVFPRSWL